MVTNPTTTDKLSSNRRKETIVIRVAIMYPNTEESFFDMDYYLEHHMPLLAELLGSDLERYEIDEGVSGGTPAQPPPYAALGFLYFADEDALRSLGKSGPELMADLPNFTDVQPVIQISQIRE
jgi:uncharacterized protein (TIGR02118 family)